MNKRKVIKWAAVAIFVIVVVILTTLMILLRSVCDNDNPFDDRRFDATEWRKNHSSHDPDNPRGQMAEDLRRLLTNPPMTKAGVIELLGPTDMESSERLLSYNLGMWSCFRIDYDSLDIYFDSSGTVEKVKIIQH